MGSDKTAITIPGGLEKLTFFTGTGRHRVQITRFFRGQIGSCTPLGVGLIVGSRLHRMRQCLGLRELWKPCQVIHGLVGRLVERIGRNMLEAAACTV